jgi:hypothetical protein
MPGVDAVNCFGFASPVRSDFLLSLHPGPADNE